MQQKQFFHDAACAFMGPLWHRSASLCCIGAVIITALHVVTT